MGNFYLYIFNFDGVLADSQRLYVNAINRALTSAGFPDLAVEPARLTSLESLDPVALAHALDVPEERHFRFCQAYLQHLESHASRCQLVPGAAQLLSTLSALAYTVLLTRSRSQLTESILLVNGLRQHVHRLVGAEQRGDLTSKIHRLLAEYRIPARRAVFVGDQLGDLHAAQRAGVVSLGCTWGWDAEQVASCDPDLLAERPGQLMALLSGEHVRQPDVML